MDLHPFLGNQVEPHHHYKRFDVEASLFNQQSPLPYFQVIEWFEGSEYVESCYYFKFDFVEF
jgi:hypothetical protein